MFGVSPVIEREKATGEVPEPSEVVVVAVPKVPLHAPGLVVA
ncbi:MAG: hypothetical protein M5U28_43515 [Sandaracinaceae bacterium]|nr:hypothetical protein [Sandaracinaceae bacterium]